MTVVRNTYPHYKGCAKIGDVVRWEAKSLRGYSLIRDSDGKEIFRTAPVDRNGLIRSTGKPPVLSGIIASVKSKGWALELSAPSHPQNATQNTHGVSEQGGAAKSGKTAKESGSVGE